VTADVQGDPSGFSLPVSLPFAMTATASTGATVISNLGAVPSHFTARLYGPAAGPRLTNETTGEEIAFTSGLVLGPGEYVEVDTRDRTAVLLSIADASRLSFVDFATTSWWRIEPGDNQLRYAAESLEPGAAAVITYRPAWL
jgi:hypothetical protein